LPFTNELFLYINNAASPSVQLCEGTGIKLTSNYTGTTYQWEQNTGSGFASISDNGNFSGTNTQYLQLSNIPLAWSNYQYRCLVNGGSYSTIFTTKVNPSIKPSISISTPVTAICSNSGVTFTATASNAGTSPSYQWLINNNSTGTNSNTFTTTTLSNNDKVRAVVTSVETCASPVRDSSNIIAMTVTPTTTQTIQIYASKQVACAGELISFTSSITGSGSNPVYQWWVNSTRVGANTDTFSSRTIPDAATVYLEMTSSLSCVLGRKTSNNLLMKINQSVTPFVNVIATATTVYQGKTTTLTATPTNGGTIPVFQWQDSTHTTGWTNIPGATANMLTYTPLATGDKVRCNLTSNSSCASPASVVSDAVTFTVNVPTAVTPVLPNTAYGLHAYPNPVSSILTIDTLSLTDHWQALEVMSIDGRQRFLSQRIGNTSQLTVNVGSLIQGIYMVILRRKNGEPAYFKFVKVY
ncbi:MAG: T9SS type A sorting domain-containing protein, partial [Bacteroidetes bacterium]|nr:T9SS type A sorting domain-containing protein [Bacteroidota bacterium]